MEETSVGVPSPSKNTLEMLPKTHHPRRREYTPDVKDITGGTIASENYIGNTSKVTSFSSLFFIVCLNGSSAPRTFHYILYILYHNNFEKMKYYYTYYVYSEILTK